MKHSLLTSRLIPVRDKLGSHVPRVLIVQALLFFALLVLIAARSAAAGAPPHFAKANPALHPYMGWSSWSFMRENITEAKIKAQARVLAARLKPFGYDYINIDSGWSNGFDRYGRPKPNLKRFPSGMAGMAAWLHAHGLKLGIYLVPGLSRAVYNANCRILGTRYTVREIVNKSENGNTLSSYFYRINYSKPGAMAYIQSCANLFARWGVDFIKMDFVGPGGGYKGFRRTNNRPDIKHWAEALKNTGRPIWLELSNGLSLKYAKFWRKYANGWRIDNDIEAYHTPYLTSWARANTRFSRVPKWVRYGGPGGWNDLDSLDIGNGRRDGLTYRERQSVMTLWCISCAPLYIGDDLTDLTARGFSILTNRAAIAIDQAGRVAIPLPTTIAQQVWRIKNPDGSFTVALFNLKSKRSKVVVRWRQLGFHGPATVRDLWKHKDLGIFRHGFGKALDVHACRLLRIRRISNE